MADPPTLKTVKSLGGHSYPAESPPPPALKTVESLGGHRYLSDNPTESTPLTEASVGGSRRKPSMELAMTRSRLRLVRTPEGRPWSFWGLAAPFANYELLGAGASAQVRIAGECLYLFAFLCLFGLPLYYWSTRNDHPLESNTAAGWSELRWGQALLEFAISVTFIGFIAYNQYRLMDAALHEVKHESKVREKAEGCTELMQEKCMGTRKGSACLPTSTVSREYADEPQKIDNVGLMLRDSHLVEACSVVLTGWGRGKRMPAAALDDLATVTGARPVMAVQAARSLELEIACERLAVLETRLAEARDQPEPHAETVARLTAEQREAAAGVMRLQRRGETLRRRPEEDLLDYAFITFASSEQRARVLEQASVLQWRLDHHGTKGARVLAAPHPGDVAWRNLEATQGQRRCSTAFFLLVMCAAHAAPPPPPPDPSCAHAAPPPPLSDPSCAGRDARRLPSRPARPPRKRAAA